MVHVVEEIMVTRDGGWVWMPINEVFVKSCKAHKKTKSASFMADPRFRIRRAT